MFKRRLILAVLILLPVVAFALPTTFPNPTGFVTDTAGMLSASSKQSLESELRNFAQADGYEIAVLTVPSLEGDTIEDYATRVFDQWKIGDKKLDTGVLFLISQGDRQMRIEVGYGAEPVLTDAQSSQILNNVVQPLFKAGNYDGGIQAGVSAIEQTLSSEPVQTTTQNYNSNTSSGFDFRLVFFAFAFLQILISKIFRTKDWWWIGALSGAIVSLVIVFFYAWASVLLIKGVFVLIGAVVGFLLDLIVSKGGRNLPPGGPGFWFIGGRGGGGSGFGSFGGGSSGGGGASGSW
jgi:uncharacterized protein